MTPGQRGEVMGKSLDGEWVWLSGPDGWVSAAFVVPVQPAPPTPALGRDGWRVAESLNTLLRQINAAAPKRAKTHDGTIGDTRHRGLGAKTDHNPNAAGVVRARDVTHDPEHGADMHALAEALRLSRDPRIKYVIFDGRMFASYDSPKGKAWTWRDYTGANRHTAHLHLSVLPDPALYDDPREWRIA